MLWLHQIQFAFDERTTPIYIPHNGSVSELGTTILTIPTFVTTGQIVNLNTTVELQFNQAGGPYRVNFFLFLRRNGIPIATFNHNEDMPKSHNFTITNNFTWVDTPLPGSQTYEVNIVNITPIDAVTVARTRLLTATLFPSSTVLPSTRDV